MIYEAILIVGFIAYLNIDAKGDYIEISVKKNNLNYSHQTLERLVFFTVFIVFHFLLIDRGLLKNIAALITMSLGYWYLFDITLNTYRGLTADYIGETSLIDKKLRDTGINSITIMFIKQWLFIGSIIIYRLI